MLRFALAYQGGGGAVTHLAGGAEIDVTLNPIDIDVAHTISIDLSTDGMTIDLMASPQLLDVEHGGTQIDISG